MNTDALIDENTQLLLRRWRYLRASNDPQAFRYMGLTLEAAKELRDLDEHQALRAADAGAALFRSAVNADVLVKLLTNTSAAVMTPMNAMDQLIQDENEFWLLNRWTAAQKSSSYVDAVFGLAESVIQALRQATLSGVQRACRRGARLAHLAPKDKYLFHAGRNVKMTMAQRTALAVCSVPCPL